MKKILVVAIALSAQQAFGWAFITGVEYDSLLVSKLMTSDAYTKEVQKFRANNDVDTRIKSVQVESENSITVSLSNKCGIVVTATRAPETKEGTTYVAQTVCQ